MSDEFRTRVLRLAREEGSLREPLLAAVRKSGSDEAELKWAAKQIRQALDLLEDVVLTFDNRSGGPSVADAYPEAAKAVQDLRATSGRLDRYADEFDRLAR